MPGMDPLVAQFYGFVAELTAPEKRSIVALTEIARDALRTHPHLAPSLATVISNRVLEVRVAGSFVNTLSRFCLRYVLGFSLLQR
jgi:hypothetical protein